MPAFTQFVRTTAGDAAVASASPTGPFINITSYQLGDGFGYTPLASDTALHGTVVYTGVPTSYYNVSVDTKAVTLTIPADAGPFEYGEIGLFIGPTLFAIATFDQRKRKLSAIVDGVPHTPRIHALLKLAQAPAVFNITTTSSNALLEVPDFSFVGAPNSMVGSPNAIIVHENTSCGDSVLLVRNNDTTWTPQKYTFVAEMPVEAQTIDYLQTTAFTTMNTNLSGRYIVVFPEGYIRSVASVAGNTAIYTRPAPLTTGANVRIYEADCARDSINTNEVLDLWSSVNLISGPPTTGDYGWGESNLPMPAGPRPTTSEWNTLTQRIDNICAVVGMQRLFPIAGLSTRFTPDRTFKQSRLHLMYSLLERAFGLRTQAPVRQLAYTTGGYGAFTGPWEQKHLDILVTFPSATSARAFFNAGGNIAFRVRSSRPDYVYSIAQRLFEMLSTLVFRAQDVISAGPLQIRYEGGEGIVTDAGNTTGFFSGAGFYGLEATRRKVFSYMVPLGGTAVGRLDEVLMVEIFSQRISATQFRLELWVTQTSLDSSTESFVPSATATSSATRIQLNESLYTNSWPNTVFQSTATAALEAIAYHGRPHTANLASITSHSPTIGVLPSSDFGTLATL